MIFNFFKYFNNKIANSELSENDICRISAYFVQDGRCYITQERLKPGFRELHHRNPRSYGGCDEATNLILLQKYPSHLLVHTTSEKQIRKLLDDYPLTPYQLRLVNQLRHEAHRSPICMSNTTTASLKKENTYEQNRN